MQSSPRLGGALALLAFISAPVLADGPSDTTGVQLGTVTTTATRTPLIADQEVAPVIVIGPQQLQLAQGLDVGGVLRRYAGLDVTQTGGPGQPESVFVRGTESKHVLVMIDGVRINPDNGFGSALQNIRLADVERIEIVKGPRSSLYGSDAIGGVINIITRKAGQGLEYQAHAGAGRYGTYDTGGAVDYGQGDSAFGLSADDYHSRGFPPVAGTSFDAGNQDRTWKAYGRTKLGGVDISLDHWQSTGYTQYAGFDVNPPFALVPFDENFQDAASKLGVSGDVREGWHSALSLSHMLDEVDQRQVDPFNLPAVPDYVHTQRNVADWQNDVALGDMQLLTLGLYTEAEHTATDSFGSLYDEAHRVNALYAEDDLDLGSQRLVLAGRDTHDQEFGNHLTWNADYGYDWRADTKFTAGAGTGFRAPSAAERFGFGGNPALQPETSQNLEIGLRHRWGQQTFSVSLFQDRLEDLIEFQPQPTPSNPFGGQNENVGHARVRGLELGYTLERDSWSWHSDAIFQDPRNTDTDATLIRRAKRTLTSNLEWHDERTSAGVNLLVTGPRPDVDYFTGGPVTDPGYVLWGLSLHRELTAGFALLVRVDNLLDRDYPPANGFNAPGRSLFLQLEYRSR